MPIQSKERPEGAAGLDSVRAEIDALDDALLDLIERRLAASAAIAASKHAEASGHLWLRPRREAAIIRRLTSRASAAPPSLVERVWRELMGCGLQAQIRVELVVHAGEFPGLASALRSRFGSSAPLRRAATADEALAAASAGQAVAILACDRDSVAPLPEGLSVFDWIRDESGSIAAAAIGRVQPGELPQPVSVEAGR